MGDLEDFIGCTIKCDLTNMILNIYQPNMINKTNQVFKDVKSIMTFNTPATSHKGIVSIQKIYKKI